MDISNPVNPRIIGSIPMFRALDIAAAGSAVYVAGTPGRTVVNMSSCLCPADIDGDGDLDAKDFFAFLDLFAAGDARADITGNGVIDANDFFAYLDLFVAGCP